MVAERTAEVTWENDLLRGRGRVRFGSGALPETDVTWASRTERPGGRTSPEELIAAAHASCYAMALSASLAGNRTPSTRLTVKSICTFDRIEEKWKITTMELTVKGVVPGLDSTEFEELARVAEASCPVSNALRNNVEIKLNALLTE